MPIRALILTLALFLAVPASALADGGNIVGTVYLDGQQAGGLCVDVLDNADNSIASQLTNFDGDFNIYVAQPGSYSVRFSDCGAGFVVTQRYPGSVEVVSDQITPQINGYLSSAGWVAGHVVDALNAVVTGACVKAEDLDGNLLGQTTTDGNGNYELGGLPAGQAQVSFEGCSAGTYLRESRSVIVQANQTATADLTFARPAFITGHVTGDGQALKSICVTGKNVVTGEKVSGDSAFAGYYELNGIRPGTYDITYKDCHATGDWVTATKTGVVVGDGATLYDVDQPLAHPDPVPPASDPAGHGSGGSGAPNTSGDPAGGLTTDPQPVADPQGSGGGSTTIPAPGCRVPKLVGLPLSKAKRQLAKAHCRTGRISRSARTHRRGRVIRQSAKHGAQRAAGARIRLTVAA